MIRFYNGRTLTFGGGLKIEPGEVWTEGGRIAYVGPAREDMPAFRRQIDLAGDLVMPSFKDAHTHSAMTFLRSFADDLPLHDWLYDRVFPREAKLTAENVYDLTRLAILEYLSGGITASFDMYMRNDAYAAANIDSGFRTVICSGLNDFDRDPENIEREYLKFNSMSELVGYRLGIHAEYTTGMERMKYMSELTHKYKAPFYSHISETKAEQDGCAERYGMTPAALFDSLGLYDYGGGGFHGVWFSDEDIGIFRRRGLWCVTNPASNLKLASGIAPVTRMLDAGVNLAIGTDGPASNNALDMFREMYLVTALQKYVSGDASACPADRVLEMACAGGARAMGLPECDDLAAGKRADLMVINMRRPNMQPENNIAKNLVYAGSRDDVRLTMVNGRVLYEDGEFFVGEEPERIFEKANSVLREMER